MDGTALEALTAEVKSGVSKEYQTIKLWLEPDPASTSESIVSRIGSRLEEKRGSYFHEVGAVLLHYGDLRITQVVNVAGGETGLGGTEEPREVTVEGEFFLFKPPKAGVIKMFWAD